MSLVIRAPPALVPFQPGRARTDAVDELLRERDSFLADVRERLLQAQQYSRCYYNSRHRDLQFPVGSWVWLRLLHHRALAPTAFRGKLSPRYAGPFKVLERVGEVAYRLALPPGARVHDVFHVGLLKPYHGDPPADVPVLPPMDNGRLLPTPARMLRACLRRGVWDVLVHWEGTEEADATWEPLLQFRASYPGFQLEDELFLEGGRDVMTGITYQRREKTRG
ncbi:hypothetical protein BS78_10G054400 [Paspalum vaginatum]|nr:hypothetical protein BS78_10G054400 [Paspalum vaginatum]